MCPDANMSKTKYSDYDQVYGFQLQVMLFIDAWVKTEKVPVPRQMIMKAMREKKVPAVTVEWAINGLLRKGFIRRGYSGSNKTYYVQLRNIDS